MFDINLNLSDQISNDLKKKKVGLQALPEQSLAKFRSLTPIDTGNARRRTTLKNKDTISADYPYAVPLDNGHSKQAPKGMTEPFQQWLKQRLDFLLGR